MTLDEIFERVSAVLQKLRQFDETDDPNDTALYIEGLQQLADLQCDIGEAMWDLMDDQERDDCKRRAKFNPDVPF